MPDSRPTSPLICIPEPEHEPKRKRSWLSVMCLATPPPRPKYRNYVLSDDPASKKAKEKSKEKDKSKNRYVAVDDDTVFYAADDPAGAPVIYLPSPSPARAGDSWQTEGSHDADGGGWLIGDAHANHCRAHPAPRVRRSQRGRRVSRAGAPAHVTWRGSTRTEVDVQNSDIHEARLRQCVPIKKAAGDQYWCRELDGSFTLRTKTDIGKTCMPGGWELSSENYWYWVREPKDE